MNAEKIWANMGVSDLHRTTKFYIALGFKPNGSGADLTSMMFGKHNFVINFFITDHFKTGLKGKVANLALGNEIIFTIGASGKAEVDQWEQVVIAADGTIISRPEEFGEGYYGFVFADPDGHRFNVFYMMGL